MRILILDESEVVRRQLFWALRKNHDLAEAGTREEAARILAQTATDVLLMPGEVCVINGPESHSGMSSLRALVAPVSRDGRFFSRVKVSGSHAASLAMIRRGEADVAAIDCVTYALMEAYRPAALVGTRKLGRTYRASGIPYVTRWNVAEDTVRRMRSALYRAFADPDLASACRALYLKDIEALPLAAYRDIVAFQSAALTHGYPALQ